MGETNHQVLKRHINESGISPETSASPNNHESVILGTGTASEEVFVNIFNMKRLDLFVLIFGGGSFILFVQVFNTSKSKCFALVKTVSG